MAAALPMKKGAQSRRNVDVAAGKVPHGDECLSAALDVVRFDGFCGTADRCRLSGLNLMRRKTAQHVADFDQHDTTSREVF